QKFTYQIVDALGNKSSFTTDTIKISLANNQAIDDTYTVQAGNVSAPGQPEDGSTNYMGLPAMKNDITPYKLSGDTKTPVIIAVGTLNPGDATSNPVPPPPTGQTSAVYTLPGTSLTATLSIDTNNPQSLDIKADAGFLGTAIFKYEIDEDP